MEKFSKLLMTLMFGMAVLGLMTLSSCEEDDDPDPNDSTGNGDSSAVAELIKHLEDNNNVIADPSFGGLSRSGGGLDPRPSASEVTTDLAEYPGSWFTSVGFKGAIDPSANLASSWMGWTTLAKYGYLSGISADKGAYDPSSATIEDVPTVIDGDVTWTSDKVYKFSGYTFVKGNLTIEPGTVVLASQDTGSFNSTIFIVTRDGTVDASGSADNPIIFTSEADSAGSDLGASDVSLWGGFAMLGNAEIDSEGSSEVQVEGTDLSTVDAGELGISDSDVMFGGSDNGHSSGTLKYVSIRFTGDALGPGNEIQGLTLGAVGSGTTLEYLDIFASSDDGIEFFGGTVDVKYSSVAFAEDDSYDIDLGYSGRGQFWFSVQTPVSGDHGGEWDGAKPDGNALYSMPTIYNATFLGRGANPSEPRGAGEVAIVIRDGGTATVANSIIADFDGQGIEIEDTDETDSYERFLDGDTKLMNNIWNVAASSDIESLVRETASE